MSSMLSQWQKRVKGFAIEVGHGGAILTLAGLP
jgi:hypothetical protein